MPIVSSSFPISTQKNWVANGDFATDITGWNDFGEWAAYTYPRWNPGGGLIIHADGGTARMQQVVTGLTVGNKYLYQYECGQADEGNSYCHLGTTEGGVEYVANLGIGNEGQHSHVFTATTTSLYIQLGATDGLTVTYRDVSLHDLGGDSTADMSTDAYTPSADFPVGPPALTLDFANSRQLDPRISFTRASGATYLGRNGLIQTAKNNEPRFDHYRDGRCKGFLIEKATTNYMSSSNDFTTDNQPWDDIGGAGTWTRTANTSETLAPDGTQTAHKLVHNSGNILRANWISNADVDGAVDKCFSVWLKGGEAGVVITIDISDAVTENFTLPTSYWTRVQLTTNSAGNGNFVDISNSSQFGKVFYAWGAQLEEGKYATSTIITGGSAVTRAADRPFIWGQNFSEWFNPTGEGTWLAKTYMEQQSTFVHGYNPWSPGNRYGSGTTSVPYPSLHTSNFRNALAIAFYANTGNVAYGNYNTVNAYSSHAPCDSNDEEVMHCVSYDTRNGYGKNMKAVCDHNDGTISQNQSPNLAADAGSASAYRDLNTHFDTLALGGNVPWEGPWGNISYNGIQMVWLMSLRYWPGRMTDSQMLSVVSNHTT